MWSDWPCKEWDGWRLPAGYGTRNRGPGRTRYVHRQVIEEELGRLLDPEEKVLHHCDNPPCYERQHLFVGTQHDNLLDMCKKRRHWTHTETHCPNGHEYVPENIELRTDAVKRCHTCRLVAREAERLTRHNKRIAAGLPCRCKICRPQIYV